MNRDSQLKVLTVGASGPTAGLVVSELHKRGVYLRGLVHKEDDERIALDLGAQEVVAGELNDSSTVTRALEGMDATFYIARPSLLKMRPKVEIDAFRPRRMQACVALCSPR